MFTPIQFFNTNDPDALMDGIKRVESVYCKSPERRVGTAFKKQPASIQVCVNISDLDYSPDTGLPKSWQRTLTQNEFNDLYQEAMSSVKKDFLNLRAGQTWYSGLIREKYVDGKGTGELEVHMTAYRILGPAKVTFLSNHFYIGLNVSDWESSGSAAVACGGLKGGLSNKMLSVGKPEYEVSMIAGGLNYNKVKSDLERIAKTYRDECLQYDRDEYARYECDYGDFL